MARSKNTGESTAGAARPPLLSPDRLLRHLPRLAPAEQRAPAREAPGQEEPGQEEPLRQVPGPGGPARRALARPRALLRRWEDLAFRGLDHLWREHRLITIAVALSLVPRMLAALAFPPALFTPDSFSYLSQSIHPQPGQWHPVGYAFLLFLLLPLHSLLVVTSVQHLMGIATAVLGYAVLRRWRLPAWGAVLAACPTLFDSRQIFDESLILPDSLYALLIMLAVAVLLTRRRPTPRRCALAGLLLAWASITRGNGAPEMLAILAVLAVQRAGWRAVAAGTAAFALPLLGYMGWFDARYGNFALTNSDGMFLWSRTMTFANCSVIKPPPGLRPLCPDRQPLHPATPTPAWSVTALLHSPTPAAYLWDPGVWWRHDTPRGFNATNNSRALRFALAAIRAQPGGYLRAVASGVMLTFIGTDRSLNVRTLHFTDVPDVVRLSGKQRWHLFRYGHVTANTHAVQPYAYLMFLYQQPVYFPGAAFLLVVVAGLAGIIRRWRQRGGPPALPWAVAATGIVFPVAVHEYHYRYVITVVPLACLAAGLAFARPAAPVPGKAAVPAQPRSPAGQSPPGQSPPGSQGTGHPALPPPAADR